MEQSRIFRAWRIILPALILALPLVRTAPGQEAPPNRDEIIHVLNRVTFGPRPGDVEAVQKMGLRAYLERQLHPESIDDSAVEGQVATLDLTQMSAGQLMTIFYDDTKKFIKKQKELVAAQGQGVTPNPEAGVTGSPTQMQLAPGVPADSNAGQGMPPAAGGGLMARLNGVSQWRSVAAIGQLEESKLVRAVESERQLQEVLVDFWTNHFNIDVKKGPCRVLKIVDDRDVIRPHIWGSFRELLEASAKSPAMLFYLDNATNTVARQISPEQQMRRARFLAAMTGAPMPADTGTEAEPLKTVTKGGINENYGREIMELHTIGVDGGYSQQDVQEVARCFTGWTINRQTGEFQFVPRLHDNGSKVVLGHVIPAGGGMQDGETVLDILASSPSCAHFISRELCQRFVSDDPSPVLVDRIAGVFQQTGGNLRQVTEAILTSPEFLSPSSFGNKIKSPLEFAVSAVRASESTLVAKDPPPFDKLRPTLEGAGVMGRGQASDRLSKAKKQSLNWHILELGEPLFACTPPTGYKEVSKTWVSPGALIERLNFAMALTEQRVSDVKFDATKILNGTDLDKPESLLNQCVAVLLQNNITDTTRKVLLQNAVPPPGESQTVHPDRLIALILGSPEFQRK